MAEKLDDSEFLKKEYAELELSFQITIDDIKFGKRQQWATTYYILLTYAAIIGFHNLIKDYLCWNQNLYSLIVLIIIALGINIYGILNIMDTQIIRPGTFHYG